jgi:hypothetical protein
MIPLRYRSESLLEGIESLDNLAPYNKLDHRNQSE